MAEVLGEAAGTVSIGPSDVEKVASITAMWVDPRFRRQGAGASLVQRALAWARAHDYRRVLLWVAEGNENAERLYARLGFARTGSVDRVRPDEERVEYEMSIEL